MFQLFPDTEGVTTNLTEDGFPYREQTMRLVAGGVAP
jgi:hypothetical protein